MNSLQEYTSIILEPINIDSLPKEALEKFEGYSKRWTSPESYIPSNFETLWMYQNSMWTCYIAEQKKPENQWEHALYIFQYSIDGSPIWYADIWELTNENKITDNTYLYFIRALRKRTGFAKTMIPLLDLLSQRFFNKHLNSTRTFCIQDDQEQWEDHPIIKIYTKLEKEEKVKRNPNGSFTFVWAITNQTIELEV